MATSNGGFIGVTLDPIFEKITTFTSSGDFTPQVSAGTDEVEVLVVSGGGGGASRYGGGGGGGGYDTVTTLEVAAETAYPVVVGGGGAGGAASGGSGTSGAGDGTIGTTSSFAGSGITTIATLGGGGGGAGDTRDGLRGGSGGGGAGGGGAGTTDGGFAVAAHAITASGDVNHATAETKHGTTSLEFDGSGDYLSLNDIGSFDWGTDDFTVEYWLYQTGSVTHSCFSFGVHGNAGNDALAASSTSWSAGAGDSFTFIHTFDGAEVYTKGNESDAGLNEWQHWAMVNDNGDVEIYLNGSLTASSAGANPDISSATRGYFIGCWYDGTNYGHQYQGYIDDFRVSSNARYTTTFTPPTSQLPHDSHTILLLQSNSSDGNTTFTDLSQGTLGREGYTGGNGGNASPYYQGAGGGGGGAAAANSTDANTAANGAGGIGYSNAISGTAAYYAGGGGGGDDASSGSKSYAASGGTGGGGAGGGQNGGATTGTVNTGGGGGGGGWVSNANVAGAAGGSGVVIVKETATGNSGIYNMDDVYAYSIDNKW